MAAKNVLLTIVKAFENMYVPATFFKWPVIVVLAEEIYDDAISPDTTAGTGRSAVSPPVTPTKTSAKPNPVDVFFYGMYTCKAATEKELEFKHGDMIEIIERRYDADGWWVGHLKGKVGLVPKSYLSPAYRKI